MELTRRDALYALFTGGSAAATSSFLPETLFGDSTDQQSALNEATVSTLVRVAEVVYPSAVSGIPEYVRNYLSSLTEPHQRAVASAAAELDSYTRKVTGNSFTALSLDQCDAVLRTMGVGRAVATREGPIPSRIRYYVVDQLLYGLYTAPKGSRLVGIENPVGHPGGYESYQRPPDQSSTDSTLPERSTTGP